MKLESLLLAQTTENSNTHLYLSAKCNFMKSLVCVHRVSGLESLILTCVNFQFYLYIFPNSAL